MSRISDGKSANFAIFHFAQVPPLSESNLACGIIIALLGRIHRRLGPRIGPFGRQFNLKLHLQHIRIVLGNRQILRSGLNTGIVDQNRIGDLAQAQCGLQ